KGFFSRRKYSQDELSNYLDPIENQSLISKEAKHHTFDGRQVTASARSSTNSGGAVPMLAVPSSTNASFSRGTAVVTGGAGGGAAGLVFAPALARRNASLPAITFVKGPISTG